MLGPWKGHVLPLHHTRISLEPLWLLESRGDRIRTDALRNPNAARYQASLRPDYVKNDNIIR